jgi:phage FluMu protein Com
MYEGPITRSRAKLLQKKVNSLLAEVNFDIFENVMPPKCSTLVVLRYTNKEEDVTLHRTSTVKNRPSDQTSTVNNRSTKRNINNSRFLEALESHEDILERLSSLVSNDASSKYFGLPNVMIRAN